MSDDAPRRAPASASWRRARADLLRELGLAMGIFDVKLTDGEPVFLEVDSQGQFLVPSPRALTRPLSSLP